MIKNFKSILEMVDSQEKVSVISIDYEKKEGIKIGKDINILTGETPYKFYIFNDDRMISGTKLDEDEYCVEVIKKEDFKGGEFTQVESYLYIDNKEMTKVFGQSSEKKLKIRKYIDKYGKETIQFVEMGV